MTEKESLLVLNQEIKSDLSFCRDCAVSQGATGWVKDFDRLLDKNEILNNKLKQQFSSCSKLSIPKKIAETLDRASKGLTEFEDYLWAVNELDILAPNDEAEHFRKWSNEEANAYALAISYVTGKALGVDLVEVEG